MSLAAPRVVAPLRACGIDAYAPAAADPATLTLRT